MIICQICNSKFNNHRGLSHHIITHNISVQEYYDIYLKKENEGICPECGKLTKFQRMSKGYNKFCSNKCAGNSDNIKEKIKQVNLKKYGCENASQNETIKEKRKQTFLERYNHENVSQSKAIKEKKKQTCLKNYGCEFPSRNNEILEKTKQTNLEKYGYEYPLQSPELQNKLKKTNLEKYGCENVSQNNIVREKIHSEWLNTFNEKLKKYNIIFISRDKTRDYRKLKCLKCNNEFSFVKSTINKLLCQDEDCCPYCNSRNDGTSIAEKELLGYIKSIYNGKIIENDRSILKGQELDIYLPDLKIAFEYNGLYWHSSEYKNENYHLNKSIECEKQGIQLVHIFENVWFEKETDIKNYIKELINGKINLNNPLVFKIENNTIFVDRKYCNGKPFEDMHYKLIETVKPSKQYITFNNINYEIYECGKLIYEKL